MTAEPSRDPQTARHDKRVAFGILGLVAATVLIGALAPMGPSAGHKAAALAPADDPADQAAVIRVSKVVYRLYADMFRALPGAGQQPEQRHAAA